jgi:hypothetical protein
VVRCANLVESHSSQLGVNIDFNIFTEKFAFAVQEAQNLARRHGQ